ncbi:MAG: double-stranded RNA/RNA-DNA hybrid binding protein-like protein [Bacteroidetes bacterium]|nr:MAG: double-stranded RNA/RNA-DNA hybrid binding protein-like protein [Bacteroidota bacterium]
MAKRQKYYVVWSGRETGIFNIWKDCEKQVKGFETARYKSFESEQEAIRAFAAGPPKSTFRRLQPPKQGGAGQPLLVSISVDAACAGNPGVMEYQGVETFTKKRLFHGGPYPEGTNNIGEFLAIVHGLGYLKKYGLSIPIYTDSKTAIAWVKKKKANTKITPNKKNAELLELISRAEDWLHLNTWDNPILKWETTEWGEIPADFGRK